MDLKTISLHFKAAKLDLTRLLIHPFVLRVTYPFHRQYWMKIIRKWKTEMTFLHCDVRFSYYKHILSNYSNVFLEDRWELNYSKYFSILSIIVSPSPPDDPLSTDSSELSTNGDKSAATSSISVNKTKRTKEKKEDPEVIKKWKEQQVN